MRIVAMFRVSTEKQASEGTSLDSQERIYHAMAKERGWNTVAAFKGCESGAAAVEDRRVLQQVLACIREKRPDALYVHEQSRLTRGDELEVAILIRELRESGVKVCVHGTFRDLDSIDETCMFAVQTAFDRAERGRIRERLMRGKDQRARQGKRPSGPAPFGYRNPATKEEGKGTLQIVESEAVVVRRIFSMAAAGTAERAIVRELNSSGFPSPTGKKWCRTTIRRVLENLAYIGTAASRVWIGKKGVGSFKLDCTNKNAIIVENAHPPIIDRDTWDAARGRPRPVRSLTPRMLTGLLFVDGQRTEGNASRGRHYYTAPKGVKNKAWLPSDMVDTGVWDAFVSLATEPAFVEELMAAAENPTEAEKSVHEIEYLTGQIDKVKRRLKNLLDMRLDGELDRAAYEARSGEETKALAALEAELGSIRGKANLSGGNAARRVVAAVRALLAGSTRLDATQRRRVLRAIVGRIDVTSARLSSGLNRDANGRVVAGSLERWGIANIRLHLRLGANEGEGAVAEKTRDRHMAPAFSTQYQPVATGRNRGKHKALAF